MIKVISAKRRVILSLLMKNHPGKWITAKWFFEKYPRFFSTPADCSAFFSSAAAAGFFDKRPTKPHEQGARVHFGGLAQHSYYLKETTFLRVLRKHKHHTTETIPNLPAVNPPVDELKVVLLSKDVRIEHHGKRYSMDKVIDILTAAEQFRDLVQ
jgi:hypothetical protein